MGQIRPIITICKSIPPHPLPCCLASQSQTMVWEAGLRPQGSLTAVCGPCRSCSSEVSFLPAFRCVYANRKQNSTRYLARWDKYLSSVEREINNCSARRENQADPNNSGTSDLQCKSLILLCKFKNEGINYGLRHTVFCTGKLTTTFQSLKFAFRSLHLPFPANNSTGLSHFSSATRGGGRKRRRAMQREGENTVTHTRPSKIQRLAISNRRRETGKRGA